MDIDVRRGRQERREVVGWVGSNIVPHEAELRARLRRLGVPKDEVSDIVQDAYLKISNLDSIAHIRDGRSYFFATARTVLLDRVRRERIVRIDTLTELEAVTLMDEAPGPDRLVSARMELQRVQDLIAALPDRCREIFELRRIQGVPQREIASRLGVAEHTVEAQATRGLRLILKAIEGEQDPGATGAGRSRERSGDRQKAG